MRVVQETTQTSPSGGASSGILRTTGALSADHELLRNLILTAGITVTNDDYEDIKRNDYYYVPGLNVRYLMNRKCVREYRLSIRALYHKWPG